MTQEENSPIPVELAGLLWTWWRGDRLPALPPLRGLRVTVPPGHEVMAALSGLSVAEIEGRIETDHQPYVAWLDATPVAYGWSAAGRTRFGSPPAVIRVPPGNRYLMDFATLPAWRGRGIYTRLLQGILAEGATEAERFWILHQHGNRASARGIEKAGFQMVAEIHLTDQGGLGLVRVRSPERGRAGAEVLGLPILDTA